MQDQPFASSLNACFEEDAINLGASLKPSHGIDDFTVLRQASIIQEQRLVSGLFFND